MGLMFIEVKIDNIATNHIPVRGAKKKVIATGISHINEKNQIVRVLSGAPSTK